MKSWSLSKSLVPWLGDSGLDKKNVWFCPCPTSSSLCFSVLVTTPSEDKETVCQFSFCFCQFSFFLILWSVFFLQMQLSLVWRLKSHSFSSMCESLPHFLISQKVKRNASISMLFPSDSKNNPQVFQVFLSLDIHFNEYSFMVNKDFKYLAI